MGRMTNWRIGLILIMAAIVAPGCRGRDRQPGVAQAPGRPNVLVVLLDDLRSDTPGYAGKGYVKTPQIDRIAAEGVNFRNAFATTSLCSPSRASLLTGLYAHRHGVTNNFTELPAALETFPEALRRFADAKGARTLYHATITWAYLLLIHERQQRAAASDWPAFAARNPDLLAWKPSVLDRFYTAETLWSDEAKRTFLMPDRLIRTD